MYLDGLLETGNLFVEPFALPIEAMVVALQVRVLLLQIVEPTERMAEALHRFVQLAVLRLQVARFALNALGTSLLMDKRGSVKNEPLLN